MSRKEELSTRLQAELASRDMSILELAKQAGITYEVVRSAVRAQSAPSWETVDDILAPLGLQLAIIERPADPAADLTPAQASA